MTQMGDVLKHLRIASRIKQKAMAEQLGISPTYLSLIENGQREPSIEILEKYAGSLNVPLAFLILQTEGDLQSLDTEQLELFEQIRRLLFDFQKLRSQSSVKKPHGKQFKKMRDS